MNHGVHVEVAQVETVVGMLGDLIAAESVTAGSVVPMGNRSEVGAPWGLYRCAGEEQWAAITCRDDADWQGLVAAMGNPAWAGDADLATAEGRRGAPTSSTSASASGPSPARRTTSPRAASAKGSRARPCSRARNR